MSQQIKRVQLILNKYVNTWEGKVLKYLDDAHPGKKGRNVAAMDLLSAAWLPFAMRFFGASDAECKEAATYSVRFLLSHACSIASEFGLPGVAMQGLVGESIGARIDPVYNPSYKIENNVAFIDDYANNIVGGNDELVDDDSEIDEFEEDEEDDEVVMLSLPSLDAGFRT